MRDIKFRGKRTDTGEWVYGGFVKDNDRIYIVNYVAPESLFIEVDPKTVGQYTGKDDKESVKIFEDDIVKLQDGYTCLIDFRYMKFVMVNPPINRQEQEGEPRFDDLCDIVSNDIEVIGNVHENPELLTNS